MAARLRSSGGLLRFYHGYSVRLTMVALKGAMDNLVFVYCKRALEPLFTSGPPVACRRAGKWVDAPQDIYLAGPGRSQFVCRTAAAQ
eukprot:1879654-Prymnesium_polylepis.1